MIEIKMEPLEFLIKTCLSWKISHVFKVFKTLKNESIRKYISKIQYGHPLDQFLEEMKKK